VTLLPIVYGAVALLFATGAIGSLVAGVGFIRVRLWTGAALLLLLVLLLGGGAFSFALRALE
jgi:hypothetical protein